MISENDAQHYYKMGGPFYLLSDVNSSDYTTNIGGNYVYVPATVGITYPDTDSETDSESERTASDSESTDNEDGSSATDSTDNKIAYTSLIDTTDQSVAKNDPNNMSDYAFEYGGDKVHLVDDKRTDGANPTQSQPQDKA